MEKRPIVIYGNCQGEALWRVFSLLEQENFFDESTKIYYFRHFNDPVVTLQHLDRDVLKRASLVLLQTNEFGIETLDTSLLSTETKIITFPYFHVSSIWPLTVSDRRNAPQPGFPSGKYPEGDRLVLKLLKENLSPEQVFIKYLQTDLRSIVDLDRIREIELESYERLDARTAVPVRTFFANKINKERIFWSNSHPSSIFFSYLSRELVNCCASLGLARNEDFVLNGDPIDMPFHSHLPIHPQVIEHYKLEYVDFNSLYRRFELGWVNFSEHLYNYIRMN